MDENSPDSHPPERLTHGSLMINDGKNPPYELKIIEFIKSVFADTRVCTVSELEDGSFYCSIENVSSSGRAAHTGMLFTRPSMIAMMTTMHMFFSAKGEDMTEVMKEAVTDNQGYSYSPGLSHPVFDMQEEAFKRAEEAEANGGTTPGSPDNPGSPGDGAGNVQPAQPGDLQNPPERVEGGPEVPGM